MMAFLQGREGRDGANQAAEALYRKAIEKDAKSIESIINLAVLMHESKRNGTEAEVLFVRALRMRCANDIHDTSTKNK
jgi:hypothetical protein